MPLKRSKRRAWTKEDIRTLKALAREKKASVIARTLKRSEDATRHQASQLGISLRASRKKKRG
jgi:hypothetical protein